MRLEYTRQRGAEGCPDAEEFSHAVRLRAHRWEPFADDGPWRLVLVVWHHRGGYEGTIELINAEGVVEWKDHGPPARTCSVLLNAFALGLRIEIDPPGFPSPDPTCAPARATSPAAPQHAPATAPTCREFPETRYEVWPTRFPLDPLPRPKLHPPEPTEKPFALRFGVGAWVETVATEGGSFGFSAEVGARYRWVSLGIEAHGDPSLGPVTVPNIGAVSFARLSGALLLCGHSGLFVGCGLLDAGRLFFPDHVQQLPASAFYGAAGVRAGLEFAVVPSRLLLRMTLDLRAPILAASYASGSATVFASASPGVGLGFGLVAELPR